MLKSTMKCGLVGMLCVALSGCSSYSRNVPAGWEFKHQLHSVPLSEPHGTLIVQRNDRHFYIMVDDHAVFKSVEGTVAAFHLAPGEHMILARYNSGARYTNTLESKVLMEEGQEILADLIRKDSLVHMRIGGSTYVPDLLEVQKAPNDPREKTLDAARKSGLQVTTDADGKVELKRPTE